jgi:APA family basic amino acid/polyamine antiporter
MDLFRTKSVASLQAEVESDHSLKRALGPVNLTLLGIGAIIGAGIFVLTGHEAAQHAGPAIVCSFILAGLASAFAGLCYAEFATMIPVSGSAYTYAYATLGEFLAWVIGWDLILEYLFAASTVAASWAKYVVSFLADFHIAIPAVLTSARYNFADQHWVNTGAFMNLPAMFIIAIITFLLVIGIKESSTFNNVIVGVKITVILLFLAVGISHIARVDHWNPPNWHPFLPYGWGGVARAAGVIFFAYIGFDSVSTAAQETRHPQRDMPIGILGSLAVCTVLYIAVSLVLTGIMNYTKLNSDAPVADAVDALGSGIGWLRGTIKIGAIAGLSSVILVMLLGQPRIFWTMAKDGLLPPVFTVVHPKFRTPWIAQILTGAVAMMIAGLFPLSILGELVSIGTLLAFVIVCVGVMVLRKTNPQVQRPFRTPAIWLVGPLGVVSCLVMMCNLPRDTWLRLFVWMAIGLVIYFVYGRSHSKLERRG